MLIKILGWNLSTRLLYPPQTLFVGGILFSHCPSVTLCFLNNSRVIAGFSSNLANMFIYARQIL